MKELEESNCEVRNTVELQVAAWDRLDGSIIEEESLPDSNQLPRVQRFGGFLDDGCKFGWISRETRLIIINVKNGECIGSWNFSDRISCVTPFPVQAGQVPLILVGLDNDANRIKDSVGLLCIFDCSTSRILRTIRMPAGVEQACVVHGGTEWEDYIEKRADSILPDNSGLVCVALRNLQHIMIDLCRPLWENSVESDVPAELELPSSVSPRTNSKTRYEKQKHPARQLINSRFEQFIGFDREEFESTPLYDEKLTNVLVSSKKIGCIISGCLGRVIIWQNDGTIGWISPILDENMYVTHAALMEPTDDPRPFYYLWVTCQNESSQMSPVLKMFAMLFERKYADKGTSLYFNSDNEPSLKFELELEEGEKIHGLSAIERANGNQEPSDSGIKHGEDSLLLISTDERMLLFDLNRWYKEQMPRTMAECRNPNSVMSSYRAKSMQEPLACKYFPSSLREFPCKGPSSPEELFYPNSLSIEWVELGPTCLTFWLARGVQAELLREIMVAGPILLIQPSEIYQKCLDAGLVPFDSSPEFHGRQWDIVTEDKAMQREMLLSLCLEQRWASFLIKCVRDWSDGSASYLFPEFLRWGVQRATEIKLIADRLCVPMFDHSGTGIGESEIKTLRFCCQQLECLSNVVSQIPNDVETESSEKQRRALGHIAIYLQVLLWFYDVGLLPESHELDQTPLQMSLSQRIPYPKEKLVAFYEEKRDQAISNGEESLFIDKLISIECPVLKSQWERECGSPTKSRERYPPPSLQSLLRSFLTDCYKPGQLEFEEAEHKHQITIYLLMDLAMLLQGSYPGVDRLIKYPSAFKLNPGLIKLTQAFWLLDHEDYSGFFDTMTGQLITDSEVKDWHHKLVVDTLLRNNRHKLALTYLRVQKPPLSSFEDRSNIIGLSVELGLLQSAFHRRPPSHYSQLLTRFFQACKTHGKLGQILHLALDAEEEEAFVEFLRQGGCEETRLLYYLQRCRHSEASDVYSFERKSLLSASKIKPISLKMLGAYNATLPEITKKFATSLTKKRLESSDQDSRYPRPMSHRKSNRNDVHEMAVEKVRETYLGSMEKTYSVPFLGAPCSALLSLRNTCSSSDANANCVLFPEKKPMKRSHDQMQEGQIDEEKTDSKRRKLSSVDDGSMSLVCNTPLVKRKTRVMENIGIETPHSILKIRQMIRRCSRSPSIESLSEKDGMGKKYEGEARPARQISFGIDRVIDDRMRSNAMEDEDSRNDSIQTIQEEESFDNEENDDLYSSPVVESKLKESAIFSGKKVLFDTHSQEGLRKSNILPYQSSAQEGRKSMSPVPNSDVPKQSGQMTPIYSASILSANSSVEIISGDSPMSINNNNETHCEDDQTFMEVDDYGLDKASVTSIQSKSTEVVDEEFSNRVLDMGEFEAKENEVDNACSSNYSSQQSSENSLAMVKEAENIELESQDKCVGNSIEYSVEISIESSVKNSIESSAENSTENTKEHSDENSMDYSEEYSASDSDVSVEGVVNEVLEDDSLEEDAESSRHSSIENSEVSVIDLESSEVDEETNEKSNFGKFDFCHTEEIEEINLTDTDDECLGESGKEDTDESGKEDIVESGQEDIEGSGKEDIAESGKEDTEDSGKDDLEGSDKTDTEDSGKDDLEESDKVDTEVSCNENSDASGIASIEESEVNSEVSNEGIAEHVIESKEEINEIFKDAEKSEKLSEMENNEFTKESSTEPDEEEFKSVNNSFNVENPGALKNQEILYEESYEMTALQVEERFTFARDPSQLSEIIFNITDDLTDESPEDTPAVNLEETKEDDYDIELNVSERVTDEEKEHVKSIRPEKAIAEDIPEIANAMETCVDDNVLESREDTVSEAIQSTDADVSMKHETKIIPDILEISKKAETDEVIDEVKVSKEDDSKMVVDESSHKQDVEMVIEEKSSMPLEIYSSAMEDVPNISTPTNISEIPQEMQFAVDIPENTETPSGITPKDTLDHSIDSVSPNTRNQMSSSLQPSNTSVEITTPDTKSVVDILENTSKTRTRRSSMHAQLSALPSHQIDTNAEKNIKSANTPRSLARTRRSTSVQPQPSVSLLISRITDEKHIDSPVKTPRGRPRRASSLQPQNPALSPTLVLTPLELTPKLKKRGRPSLQPRKLPSPSIPEDSEVSHEKDIDELSSHSDDIRMSMTPTTKGRGRKSTSKTLERTLFASVTNNDGTPLADTSLRRSTRRAVSVQKEISEQLIEPQKSTSVSPQQNPQDISINTEDTSIVKGKRGKRGASVSKDLEKTIGLTTTRTTRGSSVVKDIVNNEEKVGELKTTRATRGSSVSKEAVIEEGKTVVEPKTKRATRGSSVSKESVIEEGKTVEPKVKRTRGSSVSKQIIAEEDKTSEQKTTRKTRTSSVSKESNDEEDVTLKVTTRKLRGSSIPKEVNSSSNISKSLRSKRSSSMAKEITAEPEPLSRISHVLEGVTGSPATNTRSHRLSIPSIPEEVEEEVPVDTKSKARERRAISVDHVPNRAKRITRSILAKSVITEDVILEEPTSLQNLKKPARRKRTSSASSAPEIRKEEDVEDASTKTTKPKRNRKVSQSNDKSESYLFSLPDEASEVHSDEKDIGQTPSFKFSQPHNTKSQKFISPFTKEEYTTSDEIISASKPDKISSQRVTYRRPRNKFVLTKHSK